MVNARNVAFRVDKQSPTQGPPPAALGTVINCRNSTVKRKSRAAQSVPSQQVVLKVATSSKKRKRDSNGPSEAPEYGNSKSPKISTGTSPGSHTPPGTPPTTSLSSPSNALGQHDSSMKPFRRKPGKGFTGDTSLPWPTLLEAVHPAHLLEWRKLPVFWEFLHKYKHIWTNSRIHHYGEEIPSPTPEIDEFQFADLRHGTGCQKCKAKGTRKTYWAFLRRWCKDCFQAETIKASEIDLQFGPELGDFERFQNRERQLPTGVVDSWGNYLGAGPAQSHSLRTIYRRRDVVKFFKELKEFRQQHSNLDLNDPEFVAKVKAAADAREELVNKRREFAAKMEHFEEKQRTTKTFEHQRNKDARKAFFAEKAAAEFVPPMLTTELEGYDSYRRSIAIPKEPNQSTWNHLKPKLEADRQSRLKGQKTVPPPPGSRSTAIPIEGLLSHNLP